MKEIKKGSLIHLVLNIIIYSLCAIIVWPIMEYLFCTLIEKKQFVYTVQKFIIEPAIYGVILGIVFWIFDFIKVRKNK